MKIARLTGLILAVAIATSLALVSVASAEDVLFNPTTGKFTALSGTAKLAANNGVASVTCLKSSSGGEIVNRDKVETVLHFLECSGKETGTCSVKSKGAPLENLIATTTLHGVLGLLLPHTPALLLLATSGKVFVTLEGTCLATTKVTGTVAGEILPIGKKVLVGSLNFGEEVGHHFIPTLGGLVETALTAFSTTATETVAATIDFNQDTEVT